MFAIKQPGERARFHVADSADDFKDSAGAIEDPVKQMAADNHLDLGSV